MDGSIDRDKKIGFDSDGHAEELEQKTSEIKAERAKIQPLTNDVGLWTDEQIEEFFKGDIEF